MFGIRVVSLGWFLLELIGKLPLLRVIFALPFPGKNPYCILKRGTWRSSLLSPYTSHPKINPLKLRQQAKQVWFMMFTRLKREIMDGTTTLEFWRISKNDHYMMDAILYGKGKTNLVYQISHFFRYRGKIWGLYSIYPSPWNNSGPFWMLFKLCFFSSCIKSVACGLFSYVILFHYSYIPAKTHKQIFLFANHHFQFLC